MINANTFLGYVTNVFVWVKGFFDAHTKWLKTGFKALIGGAVATQAYSIFKLIDTEFIGSSGWIISSFYSYLETYFPGQWTQFSNLISTQFSVFAYMYMVARLPLWFNIFFNVLLPLRLFAILFKFFLKALRWLGSVVSGLM